MKRITQFFLFSHSPLIREDMVCFHRHNITPVCSSPQAFQSFPCSIHLLNNWSNELGISDRSYALVIMEHKWPPAWGSDEVSGKWAWRTLWGRSQHAHCSDPSSTVGLSSRAGQWHHRAGIAAGSCAWGWSLPARGHDVASGGSKICVNTPYDVARADLPLILIW